MLEFVCNLCAEKGAQQNDKKLRKKSKKFSNISLLHNKKFGSYEN